jgi:hypothetical protein
MVASVAIHRQGTIKELESRQERFSEKIENKEEQKGCVIFLIFTVVAVCPIGGKAPFLCAESLPDSSPPVPSASPPRHRHPKICLYLPAITMRRYSIAGIIELCTVFRHCKFSKQTKWQILTQWPARLVYISAVRGRFSIGRFLNYWRRIFAWNAGGGVSCFAVEVEVEGRPPTVTP